MRPWRCAGVGRPSLRMCEHRFRHRGACAKRRRDRRAAIGRVAARRCAAVHRRAQRNRRLHADEDHRRAGGDERPLGGGVGSRLPGCHLWRRGAGIRGHGVDRDARPGRPRTRRRQRPLGRTDGSALPVGRERAEVLRRLQVCVGGLCRQCDLGRRRRRELLVADRRRCRRGHVDHPAHNAGRRRRMGVSACLVGGFQSHCGGLGVRILHHRRGGHHRQATWSRTPQRSSWVHARAGNSVSRGKT